MIVPILVGAVGSYAMYAMLLITFVAYNVGNIIRFNIINLEAILHTSASKKTLLLEDLSDVALLLAYIVSVSLYLNILSAFVLSGLGIDNDLHENLLTTSIIVLITLIGITKGLKPLEILEKYALSITLIVVCILILAFGIYDLKVYTSSASFIMPEASKHSTFEVISIIAGMLIVVQGFETSRYLGNTYSAELRVQTSKYSQFISSIVYIVFVALSIPLAHLLNGVYDDNSLIVLVGFVSTYLVIPLIIIAALSQFSAAVADTLAATGNIQEVAKKYISLNNSYLLVGSFALVITWNVSTLEILALASRAFALYYLLQTLVALSISTSTIQKIWMSGLAFILAFITLFAIPAG